MGERIHSRREYLAVVGAAGFSGLAGCTGTEDGGSDGEESDGGGSGNNGSGGNGTDVPDDTQSESNTADERETAQNGDDQGFAMFQYDRANSGSVPGTSGPSAPVTEQWRFETGSWVHSSPAVVDDTVYFTSFDDSLYAVTASNGSERWQFETRLTSSSPTVSGGTVYVHSADAILHAVDASDGTERWRFDTDSTMLGWARAPVVVDGTVFVGGGDHLYAINAENGNERWRYRTETGNVVSSPAVKSGTVYVCSGTVDYEDGSRQENEGVLSAVDATEGSTDWQFETDFWWSTPPTVVDETIYVASTPLDYQGETLGTLHAVDASTGTERWRFETDVWIQSSPAVADDRLYVGSGITEFDDDGNTTNSDGRLTAFNTEDGREQWHFETDNIVNSSPAVADATVYVGCSDNHVYAIDADDGSKEWHFQTDDGVISSPAVVNGSVYVGSNDENLYALAES